MRRLIETPDNGLPTTYGGMSAVEALYLESAAADRNDLPETRPGLSGVN